MAVAPDWLETKAAEVVDSILASPRVTREEKISYVRAMLDLAECRGAVRGSRELGEAITGEGL